MQGSVPREICIGRIVIISGSIGLDNPRGFHIASILSIQQLSTSEPSGAPKPWRPNLPASVRAPKQVMQDPVGCSSELLGRLSPIFAPLALSWQSCNYDLPLRPVLADLLSEGVQPRNRGKIA